MSNVQTKLLLVEDDEDDYIITKSLLDDIGFTNYTLDWVDNVEQARAVLAKNIHDVCLMDYSLGPEDGVSLLKEASDLGFKAPIIMLTGQDDAQLDEDAQQAGAVDYLVKNYLNASRLARAVRYAVSRKEMEVERVERLRAESESRAKSEFLAHLSHELRTPLTAILGYTDLLLAHQQMSTEQIEPLKIIERNGHHLLSLLNDVLDLSKIEAGKFDIEYQPVKLVPFIADIYQLMYVNAVDKNIQFSCLASTTLPVEITTDSTRLRQILLNLLGNAIKFTERGDVSFEIAVDESNSPPALVFSISDTGPGISREDLNDLFKPFSQSGNIAKKNQGTGLGLAISQQLAERLNGEIFVESVIGTGSKFTLSLPIRSDDLSKRRSLSLLTEQQEVSRPIKTMIEGRVLVADDVQEIRNLVGHIMRQAGAEVVFASDGQEAIDIVRESTDVNPFDLLILDIQMPKLSGLDVARILRAEEFAAPIIALTAANMKGQREDCLANGCNDHLSKPIDRHQLLAAVESHLRKDAKKPLLLLIEDDDDARAVTQLLLESLDYEVVSAGDGQSALKCLDSYSPDMALVDINLPDINGFELASALRGQCETIKIIAVSGQHIDSNQLECSDFDQALLKPIDLAALQSVLV